MECLTKYRWKGTIIFIDVVKCNCFRRAAESKMEKEENDI